jgi:hypothetical protein
MRKGNAGSTRSGDKTLFSRLFRGLQIQRFGLSMHSRLIGGFGIHSKGKRGHLAKVARAKARRKAHFKKYGRFHHVQ